MPTYLARGVSARLGTAPLIDTVLPENTAQKCEMPKQQALKAEKLLRDSKLLNEVPVLFPDDDRQHRLNWLGNAPFIQVQAHWHGSERKSFRKTDARMGFSTSQEIQALILHVNLSDRTYISGLSGRKTSLKIEVFFNGQLSACWLITTHDARTGVKGHHQTFAGTRVGSFAERPWVILPPGMAPNGGFETSYKPVSVPERWQDICQALQNEARERGVNEKGEIPPTAEFLEALASMQMPGQVHEMQKPGGKVFGTIDVVITAGEGRKILSGVSLLKAPQLMPDKNYPLMRQKGSVTTGLQQTRSKQSSSDAKCESLGTNQKMFGLNEESHGHQEHKFHLEKHAIVCSSFSKEHQVDTPCSLELSQPKSHSQVPDISRHLKANSEQQLPITPNGPFRNVLPSLHAAHIHPSLWNPLSNATTGAITSHYSNNHSTQANAAPYTRNLHALHGNSHGLYYPRSIPHAENISVEANRFGSEMLPIPYWSPQGPPQGFGHAQPSFRSEHVLEASGQPSKGAQYLNPRPYLAKVAPSLMSHDTPRWSPTSVSSSGGCLMGPVPPVGLYSVPKKPDRSTISRKELPPSQPKKSVCEILLRRLVILGQNKKILVERQWDPPKRLKVGLATLGNPGSQQDLCESTSTSSEPIKYENISATIRELASVSLRPSDDPCKEGAEPSSDHTSGALSSSLSVVSTETREHQGHDKPLSKSPSYKKRKLVHHTAVAKPRSFLELNADTNPPLSQGCVITYAESKDQDNKKGVVRPARGEKAGEFEEDYVIFATRFFVGEG